MLLIKTLSLSDNDIFEFITAKTGWTKEFYLQQDTGDNRDIPVYTASKKPVAHVRLHNPKLIVASEEYPLISFASNGDGSAGTNFFLHINPFYISNDRTCIKVLHKDIIPEFVLYKLLNIKSEFGFDFHYKATVQNVQALVKIDVPIVEDGKLDIVAQERIIHKYRKYATFTMGIESYAEFIKNNEISFEPGVPTRSLPLNDFSYFDLSIGHRVLKSQIKKNGIPVYSANVNVPFGFIDNSNLSDFTTPSILWGIDGIFDWGYINAGKEFANTDHCGLLRLLNDKLYPLYIYYALKSTRSQYGFDRTFRASLRNIKENVVVEVPIDETGGFDLAAQKRIAEKYRNIDFKRKQLFDHLKSLASLRVNID